MREARRFSARFWLRLSAQQHPHLNRTRKFQLTLSNTSVPSAHLNRLSKSQLPSAIPGNPQQYLSAISNTSAPSAHLNRTRKSQLTLSKSQLLSAITGNPQHTSENISKFPKISQDLPKSPTQFFFSVFQFSNQHRQKTKSTVSAEYHSAVQHFFSFTMICGLHAQTKLFHSRNPPA